MKSEVVLLAFRRALISLKVFRTGATNVSLNVKDVAIAISERSEELGLVWRFGYMKPAQGTPDGGQACPVFQQLRDGGWADKPRINQGYTQFTRQAGSAQNLVWVQNQNQYILQKPMALLKCD